MSTKTLRKRIALVAVAALGAGVLSVAPAYAAPSAADMTITASTNVSVVATPTDADDNLTGTIMNSGSVTLDVTASAVAGAKVCVLVTGTTVPATGWTSAGATRTATSLLSAAITGISGLELSPTAAGTDMVITTKTGAGAGCATGTVVDVITYTVIDGGAADGVATITSGSVCAAVDDSAAALTAPYVSAAAGANLVIPVGSRLRISLDADDNMEITGPLVASELNLDGSSTSVVQSVNSKGRILIDDPGSTDELFILTATSAGSATLVVSADGASTTPTSVAANTISITIVASCTNSTFSVADSYIYVKGTDATAAVTATNVDAALSASAGSSLYINVTGNNAYGSSMTTGTYSASATNGALVNWGNAATTAPSKGTVSVATITPDGTDILRVNPASAVNTSTTVVTITHNGAPVATKTLTFYGEAASIEVVKTSVGKTSTSGAGTTTGFFLYQYKDSAGNVVPGSGAAIDPTTATTIVTTATSEKAPTASPAAVTGNLVDAIETGIGSVTYGAMSYACGSTAGSSTITIKHTSAISYNVITKTVPLSCFGGLDTYTVSLDKASYNIG